MEVLKKGSAAAGGEETFETKGRWVGGEHADERRLRKCAEKVKMGQEDDFERDGGGGGKMGRGQTMRGRKVGSCRESCKYLTLFSFPFGPLGSRSLRGLPSAYRLQPAEDVCTPMCGYY